MISRKITVIRLPPRIKAYGAEFLLRASINKCRLIAIFISEDRPAFKTRSLFEPIDMPMPTAKTTAKIIPATGNAQSVPVVFTSKSILMQHSSFRIDEERCQNGTEVLHRPSLEDCYPYQLASSRQSRLRRLASPVSTKKWSIAAPLCPTT